MMGKKGRGEEKEGKWIRRRESKEDKKVNGEMEERR